MKEYIVGFGDALYDEKAGQAVFKPKIEGELIRCKDCKYCEYGECIIHQRSSGTGLAINEETDPNGYCHRGERKE